MVKNKALPESARPCCTPCLVTLSLSLFLSLSLADLALSRLVSGLSLADAVHPEGIPWILLRLDPGRHMANRILIPLQSLLSCFSETPTDRRAAVGATEELWSGYSPVCPEGFTICCALVTVAQAGGGSSVLNLLCAKDQANENCEHRSGI